MGAGDVNNDGYDDFMAGARKHDLIMVTGGDMFGPGYSPVQADNVTALVDLMDATGGDVLAVEREILTSGLYTATNRYERAIQVGKKDIQTKRNQIQEANRQKANLREQAADLTAVRLGSVHAF